MKELTVSALQPRNDVCGSSPASSAPVQYPLVQAIASRLVRMVVRSTCEWSLHWWKAVSAQSTNPPISAGRHSASQNFFSWNLHFYQPSFYQTRQASRERVAPEKGGDLQSV